MKRTLENVQETVNSSFFNVSTVPLDIIKVIYSTTDYQVIVLKTILKFTLK